MITLELDEKELVVQIDINDATIKLARWGFTLGLQEELTCLRVCRRSY